MEQTDPLSWRTFVVYFALLVSVLISGVALGQVTVIEFNASFNEANGCPWVSTLTDCEVRRVDILASPELQKEYKIVVVPTIIILRDNEEIKRFQANIMMTMEATEKDVQEAVDEILMDSF